MSRRGRGEGTIFQRSDGTWTARIELPIGADGKRRQRTRRAKTRKEARAKLKTLLEELDSIVNPGGADRTVLEAVDTYLTTKAYRSEGTLTRTEWEADKVKKGLGRIRIGDLSVNHCDRFLNEASEGTFGRKPLKADSLRRVRNQLINTLKNEIRIGNLSKNVAEVSVLPASVVAEEYEDDDEWEDGGNIESRRALTFDEYRQLRNAAPLRLSLTIDLCGRNGLRPSEARALRWSCIDFDEMAIRVDRQMSTQMKLTRTKTKRANRRIPMDDATTEILRDWQTRQQGLRNKAGSQWQNQPAYVLTTRNGGAIDGSNLRRDVHQACNKAALEPIVPYELRHTAISHQADAGHSSSSIADWAGTSVRMIDDHYRHRLHNVAQIPPVQIQ